MVSTILTGSIPGYKPQKETSDHLLILSTFFPSATSFGTRSFGIDRSHRFNNSILFTFFRLGLSY